MSAGAPRRLLFVTSTLTTGGAEMMLYKLIRSLPRERYFATVASLGPTGRPARMLQDCGVEVVELGLPSPSALLRAPASLRTLLRRARPQLVQGWMYHGNLAAWMLAAMARFRTRLLWSVRQSLYDIALEKPLTRAVIRMNARLSARPEAIVYVSGVSREQHEALGFLPKGGHVIGNGFDLEELDRREADRARLREQWNVGEREIVIGHLARFHPAKDQATLLRAAGLAMRERPNVRLVLAGPGLDPANRSLVEAASALQPGRVQFLGETSEAAAFLSACDVFCLTSLAEGFPNALGEAMACRLPVVATAVGECEALVGSCGALAPPGDAQAIAAALLGMIDMNPGPRAELGARARERIRAHHSLERSVRAYDELYAGAAGTTALN